MIRYGRNELYQPSGIFAFADVHGEYEKLCRLIDEILKTKQPGEHIVGCGDYINRKGHNSAKVLKKLIELKKSFPNEVFYIEGNHEEMFKQYLQGNPDGIFQFGNLTLQSIKDAGKFPEIKLEYIKEWVHANGVDVFFDQLLPYYETKDALITHAPIDPADALVYGIHTYPERFLNRKSDQEFNFFLESLGPLIRWRIGAKEGNNDLISKFRICGHQNSHHKQPRMFRTGAYLDTGCGCRSLNHPLTALHYPSKRKIQMS